MKLIYIILCLLFCIQCLGDGTVPGTGTSPTTVTNPSANSVIVTTPALTSGSAAGSANWVISVQYYCSVSATFSIQTVNASGSVVATTVVPCNVPSGGAGGGGIFAVPMIAFALPQSYKMQVSNVTAVTGTVQATIYYALASTN